MSPKDFFTAEQKVQIEAAITEAEKLNLADNHFYFALLGELYTDIDNKKAARHFQKAFSLAKTQTDKQTIQKKLANINSVIKEGPKEFGQ